MEPTAWNKLIERIHESGKQLVIAVTGGGSQVISDLLQVPGGSRSLVEAVVPYAASALESFLGGRPDQFCSEPTSRAMAMAAWMRARQLAADANPETLIGIGVTASLVSNVPKRGEHRIHIGVQSAQDTISLSLTLDKGARSREAEEDLAAKLVLLAIAIACGVNVTEVRHELESDLRENEIIERREQRAEPTWTRLLLGQERCIAELRPTLEKPRVVFPGAFNPLHEGHCEMAKIAELRLGGTVAYEISITNVDKPPLEFIEIHDRVEGIKQNDSKWGLLLTTAPTFREKARLFPGATFIVGVDTLVRIADPRYYDNDERTRDEAIAEIAGAGCRFLVFGRVVGEQFCSLRDIELPAELRALCEEVAEGEFHEDVSSTELRQTDRD